MAMDTIAETREQPDLDLGTRSEAHRVRRSRTHKLDHARCIALIKGNSTCEIVARPFRGQLRAALLEIARLNREADELRGELHRVRTENQRLVPAADALLEKTSTHSNECVCPMCRGVRGYRELIRARVAAYRAKVGT